MTRRAAPAGRAVHLAAMLVLVCVLAGCSSVVSGSGTPSVSPGGSGSTSTDFPSGSGSAPASDSKYPRTPLSTSIGDPVTADLCAAIPLSAFDGLGYTPAYPTAVFPPACSIRLNTGSETRLSVYVYGIGPDNFSHLDTTGSSSRLQRSGTISGLQVKFYAFDTLAGNCQRDVIADGITLRVAVLSRAASGQADKRADCAGADAMTKAVAHAAANGPVPRLKLSTPTISAIDFCAALRATKVSDIPGYAGSLVTTDGVGDGCQLAPGGDFYFYVDFGVGNARQPDSTKPMTVGGHPFYVSDSNDSSFCNFTSTQATTSDGNFEQVHFTASNAASSSKGDLCTDATKVAARFLDTAELK